MPKSTITRVNHVAATCPAVMHDMLPYGEFHSSYFGDVDTYDEVEEAIQCLEGPRSAFYSDYVLAYEKDGDLVRITRHEVIGSCLG